MATDPTSPDAMSFTEGSQSIVDAAFLAHSLLRAPVELLDKLDERVKNNLADRLTEVRSHKPGYNNFLLFSAMIEAGLYKLGRWWNPMCVDYAIRTHETWYKGDGVYSDGPEYCWNYYNSYVIQPMYVDLLRVFAPLDPDWGQYLDRVKQRARRYAAI